MLNVEVVLLDQRGKNGKCRRYGISGGTGSRESTLSCFLTRFPVSLPLMIDRGKDEVEAYGQREQLVKCK